MITMPVKEAGLTQYEFMGYVQREVGHGTPKAIITKRTEESFLFLMKIIVGASLLFGFLAVIDGCLAFLTLGIAATILAFPLMDPAGPPSGGNIQVYQKGVVFPDFSKEPIFDLINKRCALTFEEVVKLDVISDGIIFHTETEKIVIPRDMIPQYETGGELLKKAYFEFKGWDTPEEDHVCEDELLEYLELAHGYDLLTEWDLARFRKGIDELFVEHGEEVSIDHYLKRGMCALEDILVMSLIHGFFVMEGFTLEEVVGSVNDCLGQYEYRIMFDKDMPYDEENEIPDIDIIWILNEEKLRDSVDNVRDVIAGLNILLADEGFVILRRGQQAEWGPGPWEFLLVRSKVANRIILDGKLSFRWV